MSQPAYTLRIELVGQFADESYLPLSLSLSRARATTGNQERFIRDADKIRNSRGRPGHYKTRIITIGRGNNVNTMPRFSGATRTLRTTRQQGVTCENSASREIVYALKTQEK